jgi:hypothetical protein
MLVRVLWWIVTFLTVRKLLVCGDATTLNLRAFSTRASYPEEKSHNAAALLRKFPPVARSCWRDAKHQTSKLD